jgi:hypothetical protein
VCFEGRANEGSAEITMGRGGGTGDFEEAADETNDTVRV